MYLYRYLSVYIVKTYRVCWLQATAVRLVSGARAHVSICRHIGHSHRHRTTSADPLIHRVYLGSSDFSIKPVSGVSLYTVVKRRRSIGTSCKPTLYGHVTPVATRHALLNARQRLYRTSDGSISCLTRSSASAGRPCDAKACQGLLKWTWK